MPPFFLGLILTLIINRTIMLTKHKENNESNNGDEETNEKCEEQKELPRVVWFKPTDKRVPLIALFGREIPSDIRENEEYYKTHLFAVSSFLGIF